MIYNKLGKTELMASAIGFGGIPIQKSSQSEVNELFDELVNQGINFVDSAKGYTISEKLIGNAIKGRREKFFLATKSMAKTYYQMKQDIENSLENFQTEYIDLYQLHNPSIEALDAIILDGGAFEALQEAINSGKIKHLGITTHSLEVFEKAIDMDWVETIMFPYNFLETQGKELVEKCAERNIGFITMKPMAGGAINNSRLAMRYLALDDNISVNLVGMCKSAEVIENVKYGLDNTPLSKIELDEIESIKKILGTQFCRRCGYCNPCTMGINISNCFLFHGYLDRYDLKDWAVSRYNSLNVKASECIECGQCLKRCPYKLNIPKLLKNVVRDFE